MSEWLVFDRGFAPAGRVVLSLSYLDEDTDGPYSRLGGSAATD